MLVFFGPVCTYGLRIVELRQADPSSGASVRLAALQVPGGIQLFEQPSPPWMREGRLSAATAARLRHAGAVIGAGQTATRIEFPGDALRSLMLFDGLIHTRSGTT